MFDRIVHFKPNLSPTSPGDRKQIYLLLKNHIFIARSEDIVFYLSRVRILVSPWLLTFWNRKYKYYCLYFFFITLYPSFITFF